MNERIKQLATQAGYKDFDYAIIAHKFAELIVRECMQVARGADGLDTTHESWYLIKEHFGVEE